jgi:metal-responsive CopG/Arc/MetJ family transcriptional regulator
MTTAVQKNKRNGQPSSESNSRRAKKERILVEFPSGLIARADQAARQMDKNRSELIRTAVEKLLDETESAEFNRELAEAYAANAERNLALTQEFSEVDREGF